jgi:hypothetical protein
MKVGFKAAGYSGVRSTPGISVSYMNLYTHSQRFLLGDIVLQNMIGMCVRKKIR